MKVDFIIEYFLVFNVTKVSPDGIKQLITRKNFVKLFAKQTSTKTSNTKRKLKFQHFFYLSIMLFLLKRFYFK